MRTFLFALVTLILSNTNVYAYAYDINVCLPNQIVQTKHLSIDNTGGIHFNNKNVHIADVRINYDTINIFKRNDILYFTNISVSENSLAVAYKNGAWILFQDLGTISPTKGDPVATAIFHDKNGVATGEYESYKPIMSYRGMWKIGTHRADVADTDLWTTVGLVYIDEHNNLVVHQDDETFPLVIKHTDEGFTVDLVTE